MKVKPRSVAPVARPVVPLTVVTPSLFTPLECAEIIAHAHSKPPVNGTVGYGGHHAVHDMRRSTVRWLAADDLSMLAVRLKLERAMLKANAMHWGLDARGFAEFQFTEYSAANAGHYDFHRDDNPNPAPERWTAWDRVLSCVVQLSDPKAYQGGKLETAQGPVENCEQQGSVVVFPSWVQHRVTPITAGCRYSLVVWSVGPRGQDRGFNQ